MYTFIGTLNTERPNPSGLTARLVITVEERIFYIVSVKQYSLIELPYGSDKPLLPATTTATLDDGRRIIFDVAWSGDTFDGNTPGLYEYEGELVMKDGITNPLNLKSSLKINVAIREVIESIESLANINLPYGNGSYTLPETVLVTLVGGKTKTIAVNWESNTSFDKDVAGTYTFNGVLDTEIYNPNNLQPTLDVVVAERIFYIVSVKKYSSIPILIGESKPSLPDTAVATLDDGRDVTFAVTWSDEEFDSSAVGTFYYTGTLTMKNNITNPSNLKSYINVIVKDDGKYITSVVFPKREFTIPYMGRNPLEAK